MGDFTVDTNMHCFLCSDRILHQYQPLRKECVSSLHSLQLLSNYLKIDMRKVFTEEEDVPPQLLAKVKNARLNVELCNECTNLNAIFSKLYQKLNKIEMEVGSCLRLNHSNLMRATESEDNNDKNFLNLGDSYDKEYQLWKGKRQIACLLRSEMIQKCSPKITDLPPRVKLQKMTMKQVNMSRMKVVNRRKGSQVKSVSTSSSATLSTPIVESLLKIEMPEDDLLHDKDHMGGSYPETEDDESNYDHNSFGSKRVSVGQPPEMYSIQNGKYQCKICFKDYFDRSGVRRHYKSAHCKLRYQCQHCDVKFKYLTSINPHHRTMHKGIRFKCDRDNCDKSYTEKKDLKIHIHNDHAKQRQRCQFCSKWLSTKNALGRHIRLNRCKAKKSKTNGK